MTMTIKELAKACNDLDKLITERGFYGGNVQFIAAALDDEVLAAAHAQGLTLGEMYDIIEKERNDA